MSRENLVLTHPIARASSVARARSLLGRNAEPDVRHRRASEGPSPRICRAVFTDASDVRSKGRAKRSRFSDEQKQNTAMAPLSRFLSAYHVTHAVVLLGYPLCFSALLKRAFPDTAESLWTWEKQIAATTAAVLSMKFLRRNSLDAWIGEAIRYAEASLLALSYVADPRCRVLAWGVLLSVLSYALLVPPRYISRADVQSASCRPATPASFHAEVKKTEWTREDADVAWVVFLHADWSPESNDQLPVFFDIATAYATHKQRFLTLDVGRFPEIATKTLGVPLDAVGPASAVPSALLFVKGEEIARVPRAYLEGAKVKGSRMRRVDIVKGLGIDERFERTGGKGGEAKKND